MKPQHFAVLAGSLLLVAVVLLISGRPQPANPATSPPPQLVTVVGEAEVRSKPDQVLIHFGIWTSGASASQAEALNLASLARVQAALVEAGMDEATIETARHEVGSDTYQDYSGATRLSGFQARSRIGGILKSPGKVQTMIDAALAAGATSVDGVIYQLANPEDARQAAVAKALDNARTRAAALVGVDGQSLGDTRTMEILPDDRPAAAAGAPPDQGGTASAVVTRVRLKVTFEY